MKKQAKIAVGIVVLTAIVLTLVMTQGFGLWGTEDDGSLTLHGNVDIREVELGFRIPGRIVEMPVEEGSRVQSGALLAKLDTRPLEDNLAAANARVAANQAELAKRRGGNRAQEISQASALVAERRATVARLQAEVNRRQGLVRTGAVSRADFEESLAGFREAQARLRSAEQGLSLQRAGTRIEDVATARAQVDLASAERSRAQTEIADATLRSPSAGTVVLRAREPGAIVQAGETVFTLSIDRPVRVRAYVPEPDLGRIRPGMVVRVSTDGGRTYRGRIGYISPKAEFTPKSVETEALRTDLVYSLRIIVDAADGSLRQGQPVTVSIPKAAPGQKR